MIHHCCDSCWNIVRFAYRSGLIATNHAPTGTTGTLNNLQVPSGSHSQAHEIGVQCSVPTEPADQPIASVSILVLTAVRHVMIVT